jgi:hypothetical protein
MKRRQSQEPIMKNTPFWRNSLIVLVLANLALWAWTQGHLRVLGLGPAPVEEPHRLQQQVNPEALTPKPNELQRQ